LNCMAVEYGGRDSTVPFVGFVPKSGECGSKKVQGWADPAYKLRIGAGFYGSINNLVVSSGALSIAALEANLVGRIWASVDLSSIPNTQLALSFDGGAGTSCDDAEGPGCAEVDLSPSKASVHLRDGSFRGLLLGVLHDWENCPGVSYFAPEAPCNTDARFSGGRCYKESIYSQTHLCNCLPGFFGPGCTRLCPGTASGATCGGHGECFELNGTICVCDEGYVGWGCQHECPGWTADWNVPQRICSGRGVCNETETGTGATCKCDADSQRYGDACQFAYGAGPDQIKQDGCAECTNEHEICQDGECRCEYRYFRVFGVCRPAASGYTIAVSIAVVLLSLLASISL